MAGSSATASGAATIDTLGRDRFNRIALAFVLPARCLDKEMGGTDPLAGDRCLLKSFPAWTMTNWASFAMISSGSGMLAYGSVYGRNRERPTANVRVAPFAGRTYAGIGLGGQF